MHPDPMDTADLIDRICGPHAPEIKRVTFVVAHPDDEILSAGSLLPRLGPKASVICLTDGAPRGPIHAHAAGFKTREAYAQARRQESESALSECGIGAEQCRWLGITDQELMRHLVQTIRKLDLLLDALNPDLVLTHPYEGGHPDHDSAAFVISVISKLRPRSFHVAEFASYNAGSRGGGWSTSFLPHPGVPVRTIELSPDQWKSKRHLMELYVSQKWILDVFSGQQEHFRPAPAYDFSRAPHPGELFYERMPWGINGAGWRAEARIAADELEIR